MKAEMNLNMPKGKQGGGGNTKGMSAEFREERSGTSWSLRALPFFLSFCLREVKILTIDVHWILEQQGISP